MDGLYNPVSSIVADQLNALMAAMPTPALVAPVSETTVGSAGTDTSKYAQAGHSHPRLTSTTNSILGVDGTATITFTRSFVAQPGIVMTEVNATSTQPLVLVVQSFIQTNGLYTGATIRGYRSTSLPSQTTISAASLLTTVVTAFNAVASSISGFNLFGGPTMGAQVSVIAIARSDV